MIKLIGYADRLSVAPGETIEFKVSSAASTPYRAGLVRVICGDPNPAGPGVKEAEVDAAFAGEYPSRRQSTALGSHARVADATALDGLDGVTLTATIWPTTPTQARQGLVSRIDVDAARGIALTIDADGSVGAMVGTELGEVLTVSTGRVLTPRAWYRAWCSYDPASATLRVGQQRLEPAFGVDDSGETSLALGSPAALACAAPLLIGALDPRRDGHYNGKIEAPAVLAGAADPAGAGSERVVAAWDFSRDMSSARVEDTGPHGLHGVLVNCPARAMKGSGWTGEEMCWRHAPAHYGAIHFHDDDLGDCGWDTDFSYTVPADLPSGVYAARLEGDGHADMIPFFVRAPRGRPRADACVLIPTFTYIVYANYARGVTNDRYRARVGAWGARPWTPDEHSEFGHSTYDLHGDGSGISYSSRLRPILNLRSAFLAYHDPHGSGLRHFPADTHLLDWLEALGHDYDVITDEDLHAEGVDAIAGYRVVMTTSHPEYHTPGSLDALTDYVGGGGRLMYLGGNGFYWKVAVSDAQPGVVEIRRGEGGIRAWAADPGEYYNSLDGTYGGLWRRNDRPPQALAGVGFTSQGPFVGSYYRRLPAADDPAVSWIFDGVRDEVIGDFGLSGGGAAGFELDRADHRLGSPPNLVVLARSEGHADDHILVHEERLTDVINWPRQTAAELVHADMVYFDTPNGGAVFSVGSITFCGSLAHDDYRGNVSRILDNVLRRFRAP